MTDLTDLFIQHARVARRTLARVAALPQADVDRVCDDCGFGQQLRLIEVEEVLTELKADDEDDTDDDGDDTDEDDEDDEDEE